MMRNSHWTQTKQVVLRGTRSRSSLAQQLGDADGKRRDGCGEGVAGVGSRKAGWRIRVGMAEGREGNIRLGGILALCPQDGGGLLDFSLQEIKGALIFSRMTLTTRDQVLPQLARGPASGQMGRRRANWRNAVCQVETRHWTASRPPTLSCRLVGNVLPPTSQGRQASSRDRAGSKDSEPTRW